MDTKTVPEQTEAQKKLHDLLANLWEQRKGILMERLATLQQSIADLDATGSLTSRKTGAETAHKLAGILGTFGLPQGTDLAREAEVMLEGSEEMDAHRLNRLRELAGELGKLLQQRSLPDSR